MVVSAEVSAPDLVKLAKAVKQEENGLVMRKEIIRDLRAAIKPAVQEAKSSIMSLESRGLKPGSHKQKGGSIRRSIARQIGTEVSLSTRSAKVKVRVRKRNMPRGFKNAPKAYQLAGGWRHPVYEQRLGKKVQGPTRPPKWVHQMGKPGWFDVPLRSHRLQYQMAVQQAMNRAADRIARRA